MGTRRFALANNYRAALFCVSVLKITIMSRNDDNNKNTWVGIVLVGFGAFFLARNLDLIPWWVPGYLFGWEMIMVLIGGAMLVTGRREGLIFLAIGALFLVNDIFYLPHFHIRDWWPVILIIVGLAIFIKRREVDHDADTDPEDRDFFTDTAIFGGSEREFTSPNFKGGKVTSIFGGSDIDFRNAQLGKEEVIIDQFCMFGGSAFRVPDDWTVINDCFVLFGGFGDKRANEKRDPNKVLRIKGTIIFGGGEIK